MELETARAEFEAQLAELRRSMGDALGVRPRRSGWWALLLATAVGLALGSRARSGRRELEESAPRDPSLLG